MGPSPLSACQTTKKPENMLYSEFINRVGRVCSVEEYRTKVKPEYYNFPGNKDEFCLQFLGRELQRATDEYMESRNYLEQVVLVANDEEQIEVWTEDTKMWDEIWNDLMDHREALIKRMRN